MDEPGSKRPSSRRGTRNDASTPKRERERTSGGVSRRSFIQTVGVSAAASAVAQRLDAANGQSSGAAAAGQQSKIIGPGAERATFRVNGQIKSVEIEPSTTLLDALRHDLNMTGSKEICDRGACGGCSVMVDGVLIASCMMLAHDAAGREVTTVEGLADGDQLDPVQEAYIRHDALQCGYCTPGFIIASRALLNDNAKPTYDEIREGLSGNYCRCGCHCNAINAVLDASGQKPEVEKE